MRDKQKQTPQDFCGEASDFMQGYSFFYFSLRFNKGYDRILPISHNPYSLGLGDYMQKDTRSLSQSLHFFQVT